MAACWINTLDGIYREYGRALVTYARSITGHLDLAEDPVQEAFVRIFRVTSIPDHPRSYVFRTVRNASIDCLKKSDRSHQDSADGEVKAGLSSSAKQLVEDAESIQLAHDASTLLPREQREINPLQSVTARARVYHPATNMLAFEKTSPPE